MTHHTYAMLIHYLVKQNNTIMAEQLLNCI